MSLPTPCVCVPGQGENEVRCRLFRLCLLCSGRCCLRRQSQPSLAGGQHMGSLQVSGGQQQRPGEEAIRLTASRSFNALCGGPEDRAGNRSQGSTDRKWNNNNGYRGHQSRSTDNLLDEIKSE